MLYEKKRNACMAVAMVAVMLAASFCMVMQSEDSDAASSTHEIELRVGDSFSYTPQTNLTSTITATGTAMKASNGFLQLSNGVLSGTPTKAGNYAVTLNATWKSGDLQQTVTQKINFTVYDRIQITSGSSETAIVGQQFSYDFTFTGPAGTTLGTPSISNGNWLTWNAEGKKLTGTPTSPGETTVTFEPNFTSSTGKTTDSKSFTLTINTFAATAITSAATSETYVGADYSYTITSSVAGSTFTANLGAADTWLDFATPTISGTFLDAASPNESPYYKTYTVALTATGMQDGVESTGTMNHVIKVYSALAFISVPTINDVVAKAANADSPRSLLISATVAGATSVTIDWGDETVKTQYTPQENSIVLVPIHDYAKDGIYTVTITATNDQGDTVSKIKYDTTDGSWTTIAAEGDTGGQVKQFIQDNSILIVGAVLALLFGILALARDPRMWIPAIVCIIVIVACYMLGYRAF